MNQQTYELLVQNLKMTSMINQSKFIKRPFTLDDLEVT